MGDSHRVWPFYLEAFLTKFLYVIPIYSVVFYQGLALSFTQIGILMALIMIFRLLSEIPTGVVADLYGRKVSTLIGYFVIISGFVGIFFSSSFMILALYNALIGIGTAFVSGALEAWMTDNTGHKRQRPLMKLFSWRQSLNHVGLLISGFIGTWLVFSAGFGIIWLAGGLSYFLGGAALLIAKEKKIPKIHLKKHKESFKNQLRTAKNLMHGDKNLLKFLLAVVLMGFALSFTMALVWIPFLQNLGFPNVAFGFVWSLMAAVGIFAPIIGEYISRRFHARTFMGLTISLWILALFALIFVNSVTLALIILVATLLFDHAHLPIERAYFQRMLKTKVRATIGSIESLLIGVAGAIGLPLAGLAVDLVGAKETLLISGFLLIPVAILFWTLKKYANEIPAVHS